MKFCLLIGAIATNLCFLPFCTAQQNKLEIIYKTQSSQGAISLAGESHLRWSVTSTDPAQYELESTTTANLLGTLYQAKSKGRFDAAQLHPNDFTEQRLQRPQTHLQIDHDKNLLRWADKNKIVAAKPGTQDKLSVLWQLVLAIKKAGDTVELGQRWSYPVAASAGSETWSFEVFELSDLRTDVGNLKTIHLVRTKPKGNRGSALELWLAPSLEYYPVQIRFDDGHGTKIEQKISQAIHSTNKK